MKKVVIIGGGIAGLTAGIYLQQAGMNTVIFEKNTVPGGQCTGWKRGDYFIDNCIHWLTGTREGTALYDLWENVGALGDGVELYKPDRFYTATMNGETITFWRDLERTRKEMLELSPEDAEEINKFIDFTRLTESMTVPVEKPFDMMSLPELMKLGKSMADMSKVMKEYGKENIEELGLRFKHPLIRLAIKDYMPPAYQAYSMLVSYGTIAGGNGEIPAGGSKAMALRIAERYKKLGGDLRLNTGVKKILHENGRATGILLSDGAEESADYVVSACDTDYLFRELLDCNYMPKALKKMYDAREKYPVVSGFQVAFALEGKIEGMSGNHLIDCEPMQIAETKIDRISYRCYDYEPSFAPEGNSILQSNMVQTEKDYEYWEELYKNPEKYKETKLQLADKMRERLEAAVPELKGKLTLIDTWTPVTYHRYCNAYHGAYMSFIITKKAKDARIPGVIKKLPNVMIASQWLMGPGGLPTAAAMGKFAAYRICQRENS